MEIIKTRIFEIFNFCYFRSVQYCLSCLLFSDAPIVFASGPWSRGRRYCLQWTYCLQRLLFSDAPIVIVSGVLSPVPIVF